MKFLTWKVEWHWHIFFACFPYCKKPALNQLISSKFQCSTKKVNTQGHIYLPSFVYMISRFLLHLKRVYFHHDCVWQRNFYTKCWLASIFDYFFFSSQKKMANQLFLSKFQCWKQLLLTNYQKSEEMKCYFFSMKLTDPNNKF